MKQIKHAVFGLVVCLGLARTTPAMAAPTVDYLECLQSLVSLDASVFNSPYGACVCQLIVGGMPADVADQICLDTYHPEAHTEDNRPAGPGPTVGNDY